MSAATTPHAPPPLPPWANAVAGATAGATGVLLTCPFEVVKTRLQASTSAAYRAETQSKVPFGLRTLSTFRTVARSEGIRGLWRGVVPTLVGVMPARGLYFTSYSLFSQRLPVIFPSLQDAPPAASHVIAGVLTSWTVSLALSPVWIVKTRMQLQLQPELANSASLPSQTGSYRPYTSIWDCVRRIGAEEGIRGYYKGMSASLLGASETALHFLVYEQLKMWRRAQRAERKEEASELSPTEFLSYAAAARVVATTSVYPHETVRTRLREQRAAEPGRPHKYRGLLGTFRTIFREEGRRGLYSGMGVHLLRSVPNAAVLFATYELVSRVLRRHLYEELPFAEDDP